MGSGWGEWIGSEWGERMGRVDGMKLYVIPYSCMYEGISVKILQFTVASSNSLMYKPRGEIAPLSCQLKLLG